MRPLKAILAVMFFLLTSCGGIDFVYKDESKNSNPLLNKTEFFGVVKKFHLLLRMPYYILDKLITPLIISI